MVDSRQIKNLDGNAGNSITSRDWKGEKMKVFFVR